MQLNADSTSPLYLHLASEQTNRLSQKLFCCWHWQYLFALPYQSPFATKGPQQQFIKFQESNKQTKKVAEEEEKQLNKPKDLKNAYK